VLPALFKKALFKKCSALPRSDSVRGLLLQGWELAGGTLAARLPLILCPGSLECSPESESTYSK
jgi:hypothetical protein